MDQINLKSRQIKAARALLDWSQDDLSDKSSLSINTIRKLELGHISPRGKTSHAIRQAFEDYGIEFMDYDGVRLRPEELSVISHDDSLIEFFDNVYHHAKRFGGELLSVCHTEAPFMGPSPEIAHVHIERMSRIKNNISAKCIITDSDQFYCSEYSEYRRLSKHFVDSVPFYVYGEHCAFFVFHGAPHPKIFIIKSEAIAQSFRRQFQSMWEKATPLNKIDRPPPTAIIKRRK